MQYKQVRIDGELVEVPAEVNEVPLVLDPALTNMFNHGVRPDFIYCQPKAVKKPETIEI